MREQFYLSSTAQHDVQFTWTFTILREYRAIIFH